MNRRLALLGVGAACLSAGCASDTFTLIDEMTPAADVVLERAQGAADRLYRGMRWRGYFDAPVLMGILAQVDNTAGAGHFGRILSEQISARLAYKGVPILEVPLRGAPYTPAPDGGVVLSDEFAQAQQAHKSKLVIVGAYAAAGSRLMVTLKAVDLATGRVVTGASFVVPRQDIWRRRF